MELNCTGQNVQHGGSVAALSPHSVKHQGLTSQTAEGLSKHMHVLM